MHEGERGFVERDRLAARNFAAAARANGVRHVIYLGALGRGELSPHLASRQETGRILREAGVPVTELRAAMIIGPGSASFELMRSLVDRLPVMICPRWVTTRCQPIAVDDVLHGLLQSLEVAAVEGRTLEIGGADVLTYADMMLGYAAERGRRRWLFHVPFMTPRLSSWWCHLVTPIPASIARPLIDGLRTEVVVHDGAWQTLLGIRPLGYREALRRALDAGAAGLETVQSGSIAFTKRRPAVDLGNDDLDTAPLIRDRRRITVAAPPVRVFEVLSTIGGADGWFYADALWRVRARVDRLIGGVGLRRGRRDSQPLQVGDPLDFWRVDLLRTPHRLRLLAEMKLPGRAWLEWTLTETGAHTLLTQTAIFQPRGLAGVMYWHALGPAHRLIFGGMLRAIAARAETSAIEPSTVKRGS